MSTPQTTDKVLETVRKLIAKAESLSAAGNEAEAHSFMGKANELMQKHAIDQFMLDQHRSPEQRRQPIQVDITLSQELPFWSVQKQLCRVLTANSRCQGYATRPGFGSSGSYHVIGFPSDANYVDLLFTSIYMQMEQQFASDMKRIEVQTTRKTKKDNVAGFKPLSKNQLNELEQGGDYRIEFMLGYVNRIQQRFAEMQMPKETSTELVLVGVKEAVDDAFANLTSGIHWSRARDYKSDYNSAARDAGRKAANTANLRPGHGLGRQGEIGPGR